MRDRRPGTSLLAVAAALLLAVGCGDDAQEAGAPEETAETVSVVGQNNLTWDAEELTADAGTVTVMLTCEDAVNHNFHLTEPDQEVVACAPDETATGTVELDAGEYEYLCTVPGHSGTMRGVLTIS